LEKQLSSKNSLVREGRNLPSKELGKEKSLETNKSSRGKRPERKERKSGSRSGQRRGGTGPDGKDGEGVFR